MNIIILGAGRVGESVAESLVSEKNDITVIDTDPQRLRELQDRLDLRGVAGNGIQPSVLQAAGAGDADMLIACAPLDETNLVACKVAHDVFNIPTRIARLRSPEFVHGSSLMDKSGFAVDQVICPEESLTTYIRKLIEYPEALQVLEFAGGAVSLIAVRAVSGGPMVRHVISELPQLVPASRCASSPSTAATSVGVDRQVVCDGTTRIEPGDEVFVLAATRDIRRVLDALRRRDEPVRRVMIAGGGHVGLRLAREIEADCRVKMIEANPLRCEYLSSQLQSETLVLHGDSTDEDLLGERERAGHRPVPRADQRRRGQHHGLPAGQAHGRAARAGADQPPRLRRPGAGHADRHRAVAGADRHRRAAGLCAPRRRRGGVQPAPRRGRGAGGGGAWRPQAPRRWSGRRIEELPLPPGAQIGAIVRAQGAGGDDAPRSSSRTTTR